MTLCQELLIAQQTAQDLTQRSDQATLEEYHKAANVIDEVERLGGVQYISAPLQFTTVGTPPPEITKIVQSLQKDDSLLINALRYNAATDGDKIKAKTTESLLYKSLLNSNIEANYTADSHATGSDIYVAYEDSADLECGISVKSGRYLLAPKQVQVSGSRTGKFPSLQQKLDFLQDDMSPVFFLISEHSDQAKTAKQGYVEYRVIIFPGELMDLGSPSDWEKSGKNYALRNPRGILSEADIRFSLSEQFWFKIDIHHADFVGSHATLKLPYLVK